MTELIDHSTSVPVPGAAALPRVLGARSRARLPDGRTVEVAQLNNAATTPPFERTVREVTEFLGEYGALHHRQLVEQPSTEKPPVEVEAEGRIYEPLRIARLTRAVCSRARLESGASIHRAGAGDVLRASRGRNHVSAAIPECSGHWR